MTDYYVRITGDDTDDGLSAGAAWATIAHAMDTISAGDTVYIGAGTHTHTDSARADFKGTNGNPKIFQGDPYGEFCGDGPGPVVITSARTNLYWSEGQERYLFELTGDVEYVEFHDLVFLGNAAGGYSIIVLGSATGARAFSGVVFEDCMFFHHNQASYVQANNSVTFDYGDGAVPVGNGLRIRRCLFNDLCTILYDSTLASVDIDLVVESCVGTRNGRFSLGGSTGTYGPLGILARNITCCRNTYSVFIQHNDADDAGAGEYHNILMEGASYFQTTSGSADTLKISNSITEGNNVSVWNDVTWKRDESYGVMDYWDQNTRGVFFGQELNMIYEKYYGTRPFQCFEPFEWFGMKQLGISAGNPTQEPLRDYYNRPFGKNRAQSYLPVGMFNGDYSSTWLTTYYTWTDPDSTWTTEAAINESTFDYANSSAAGTINTNYLRLQNTSVNIVPTQTIQDVYIRMRGWIQEAAGEFYANFYTSGEAENLGTITWDNDPALGARYYNLQKIPNAPAGGWTPANIASLECRIWRNDAAGAGGFFRIYRLSIYIDCGDHDVGAVSSRGLLEVDTTNGNGSDQCLKISRAGFYQTTCPVVANTEITVSADAMIDSNYSNAMGDRPQLQVYNIPGGIDEQTDSQSVVPDDTWSTMSVAFTPTLDGYATIRVVSFDESKDGETFFDNITWS